MNVLRPAGPFALQDFSWDEHHRYQIEYAAPAGQVATSSDAATEERIDLIVQMSGIAIGAMLGYSAARKGL